MSIKTNFEFSRSEDIRDVIKHSQRLSQDLGKNFRSIKNSIDKIITDTETYQSGINGVSFSSAYSVTASLLQVGASTFTFTHNFGSIPNGFIVVDLTSSNTVYMTPPVVTRDSWTTTQIVVRISSMNIDIPNGLNRTISGDFKIIVLR